MSSMEAKLHKTSRAFCLLPCSLVFGFTTWCFTSACLGGKKAATYIPCASINTDNFLYPCALNHVAQPKRSSIHRPTSIAEYGVRKRFALKCCSRAGNRERSARVHLHYSRRCLWTGTLRAPPFPLSSASTNYKPVKGQVCLPVRRDPASALAGLCYLPKRELNTGRVEKSARRVSTGGGRGAMGKTAD